MCSFWQARGFADARKTEVIFLTLGADMDFFVENWGNPEATDLGDPSQSKSNSKKAANKKGKNKKQIIKNEPYSSLDALGGDPNAMQIIEVEESSDDDADDSDDGATKKGRGRKDVTRITMTHGCLLVVRNCFLEVGPLLFSLMTVKQYSYG